MVAARVLWSLLTLALLPMAGCFGDTPASGVPGCGPDKDVKLDTKTPLASALRFDDGYMWRLEVTGACPKAHAEAHASLLSTAPPSGCPSISQVQHQVVVSPLFEPYRMFVTTTTYVENGDVEYNGQTEAGLKQAYGDAEAHFTVETRAFMLLTGDEQADRDCIEGTVKSIYLSASFYEFKAPATE